MNKYWKIILLLTIAILTHIFPQNTTMAFTQEEDKLIQEAADNAQRVNEESAVAVDKRTDVLLGELRGEKWGEGNTTTSNSQNDLTKSTYMLQLKDLSPINKKEAPWWKEAVKVILSSISSLLLFILPIIAAISLIVAGYYYILSSGDSEKASQAKTIIKWNVIAIIVALFSYAIIQLIASVLGGKI